MRTIKFRAWDGEKMTPAFYMGSYLSMNYSGKLMQYTGLNDKNGKEIYEGDVIESFDSENKPIRHLIEYSSYDAKFIGTNADGLDALIKLKSDLRQDWIIRYDKSIIGNIYENPELIK